MRVFCVVCFKLKLFVVQENDCGMSKEKDSSLCLRGFFRETSRRRMCTIPVKTISSYIRVNCFMLKESFSELQNDLKALSTEHDL